MNENTELVALERNLLNATEAFRKAQKAEDVARRDSCSARNNLNAAQKQLDAYLKKLRETAPNDSDWGLERKHRFAAKEAA